MTTVATVSYLNARPLVDGLDNERGIELIRRVPSGLLETLENGAADVALCPVIDFQRSSRRLEIVPSGAIGCDGPSLTVKLFSRVPLQHIDEVAVDGDSHTSAALLAVILDRVAGRRPAFRPLVAGSEETTSHALMLIGDKVVTAAPDDATFPYRLDLGQAWRELTGRPFVFAVWMTRAGCDLGDLPERLARVRHRNLQRLGEIAAHHAAIDGWPAELATTYLSRNLTYRIASRELAAIEEFWQLCHERGIIDELRPMRLYGV